MTTKDFGRERPRRFSIGFRWGELGEPELLLRPQCVKPRCPGGLAVFHILVEYVKDRQTPGAPRLYTLGPQEKFGLSELAPTEPDAKPPRSFTAKVLRGHLEKPSPNGEGVILRDVQVRVKRVVHFREFDPKAKRPARLEYLL